MEGRALTAAFVRNVGGTGKARRYGDGNGLYLLVKPGGRKSWVQRIVVQGVRRDLGLGSANLVTLKEARQLAHENRRLARAGEDPQAPRNVASPSFADALESVIGMHAATWKEGGRTADQWRASMARYVLPRLGRKGVHAVTTADIMAVLSPIWVEKHETARRIRRRIGAVMNWAMAQGYRPDNPAGDYDSQVSSGSCACVISHGRPAMPLCGRPRDRERVSLGGIADLHIEHRRLSTVLGYVVGPLLHQGPPSLEQIRTCVRGLGLIPYCVCQCGFHDRVGCIGEF